MGETRVYLRVVDLSALTDRYLNGEFTNLNRLIEVDPTPVVSMKPILQQKIVHRDHHLDVGAGQLFSCLGYKVHDNNGNYTCVPGLYETSEYNCMYCLTRINQKSLGIPLHRTEENGKIFYHCIDIFCSFECTYAEILSRRNNTLYVDSLVYLAEIYHLMTGKDITGLKPASDKRMLKIFNGKLSPEEFHSDTVKFPTRPGNVFFLPVMEYLEQDALKSIANS